MEKSEQIFFAAAILLAASVGLQNKLVSRWTTRIDYTRQWRNVVRKSMPIQIPNSPRVP